MAACPECGGQGIDTSHVGRPTARCEWCRGTGRVPSILERLRQETREETIREQNMLADEYDMLPEIEYREARWRHP